MIKLRESSIDIHVPELADLLRPWRQAAATKGIPPHVTVLYPWRTPPLTADDLNTLRGAIAGTQAFAMKFVGIERFAARAPYLKIADEAAVCALMRRIHSAFPDTPPYGGEFRELNPHLTIAKDGTDLELDQLQSQISPAVSSRLPLSVHVRSLVAMEEGRDGYWRRVVELPLAL